MVSVSRTGVSILPDSEGKSSDPAPPIVRATDGRFYTAAQSEPGRVLVWNADGTFARMVGRRGDGPGEFSGQYLGLFAGPGGDLYVRSIGRWTVYGPDGVLRWIRPSTVAGDQNRVAILQDGAIVSSRPGNGFAFHVVRAATDRVQSFEPLAVTPDASPLLSGRTIAAAGGTDFWALPIVGRGAGYKIELRDTTGQVRRTIRREVAWFPPGSDAPGPPSSDSRARNAGAWSGGRPPNSLDAIALDDRGLLFVYASVVLPTWRLRLQQSSTVRDEAGNPTWEVRDDSEFFETHLEIIDTRRGVVLASAVIPDAYRQFSNSRLGYQRATSPDGGFIAHIVEFSLQPRR